MSRDRGVNAVDIPAKERHDAGPLLLPRALPAPRSLYFVGGLLLVATLGLIVCLAVAPDTSAPATAPAVRTIVPSSVCERALARDLAVAHRALVDYGQGRARAGRDLYLSQTAALPVGCGR